MTPLADPPAQPWELGTEPWAELRTTHSGAVLLLGDRAYKFKLPVRLDFLDFTSRSSRVEACRRELELNSRLTPAAYLGLGALEQPGAEAEPVLVMRRQPDAVRLQTMVLRRAELIGPVAEIARELATFHARARRGPDVDREGSCDAIRARWGASFEQVRTSPHPGIDDAVLEEIQQLTGAFLDGRDELFADRVRRGRVVDGHGDLLAEDIFCVEDGPQILDCLDFDPRLRAVDGLDDVSCLAMDLERLGAPEAAWLLLDRYAEFSADPAPRSLVHHFMAYRAFVRAKVGCLRGAADEVSVVRAYAASCLAHLRRGAVRLVLVGGPPGSGKSTLAGGVADRLGYVVLSSDRLRKELAGLDPETPAPAAYGVGLYGARSTDATYAELLRRAGLLLARGESVVVDATWSHPRHRAAAERLAEWSHAELVPLGCRLPVALAQERVRGRRGPSDADADVVARASAEWPRWPAAYEIDTRFPPVECAARAAALIGHDDAVAMAHEVGRR